MWGGMFKTNQLEHKHIMEPIKKTLSYFIPEEKIEANRREHMRLSGEGMTVIVGETYYDVINWSQGGILLKAPTNQNTPSAYSDFDLTMKLHSGDNAMSSKRQGRIIRKGNDTIAIAFEPLEDVARVDFVRMVDTALTESFVSSQVS